MPLGQQGRTSEVLASHPAEIGVRVRLAIQEFVDESLYVIGSQVFAPPREQSLIYHRGRGDGTQRFAACATRPVSRKNLHMVRQCQELVSQTGEKLTSARVAGCVGTRSEEH